MGAGVPVRISGVLGTSSAITAAVGIVGTPCGGSVGVVCGITGAVPGSVGVVVGIVGASPGTVGVVTGMVGAVPGMVGVVGGTVGGSTTPGLASSTTAFCVAVS